MTTLNEKNALSQKPKRAFNFEKYDAAALTTFAVLLVLFCLRAFSGFSIPDETGQITGAHRYILGEGLLSDEWHVAQFMAFVEFLPIKLFTLITGSTDGVVLFFRYVYVAFQFTITAVTYFLLRKKYKLSAFVVCLMNLLVCTSVLLFSFSYYTICTDLMFLTCVLLHTSKGKRLATYILPGVLFALTVVCYPPFAFLYFVYAAVYAVLHLTHKSTDSVLLSSKAFSGIFVGIAATAVLFIIFMLSQSPFSQVINNFKYLLIDAEHLGIFTRLLKSLRTVLGNYLWFLPFICVSVLIVLDKKKQAHTIQYIVVCTAVLFVETVAGFFLLRPLPQLQTIVYPAAFLNVPLRLLGTGKKSGFINSLLFSGALMAVLNWFGSGQGYLAASSALWLCAAAAYLTAAEIVGESKGAAIEKKAKQNKKAATAQGLQKASVRFCTASFLCLCAVGVYVLVASPAFFENSALTQVNRKTEKGPYAGIRTTQERYEVYDTMLDDLDYITENYSGRIFAADAFPWVYMYVNRPYGAFSSWILKDYLNDDPRLKLYYEAYPENMPEVVYVPKVDRFNYKSADVQLTMETVGRIFSCHMIRESEAGCVLAVDGLA